MSSTGSDFRMGNPPAVRWAVSFLFLLAWNTAWGKSNAPVQALPVVEDSIPRWGRVARSPERVLYNALYRLAARDTLGLFEMGLNPGQFAALYPETPDGQGATEIQLNFAKEFYFLDNQKLMFRRLQRDGGKDLELISWKALSPPAKLKNGGTILRDIEMQVRDRADNKVRRLFFVQSIYSGPQGCKIWGYQDDKGTPQPKG